MWVAGNAGRALTTDQEAGRGETTGQSGVRDNAAAGITTMRLKEFSSIPGAGVGSWRDDVWLARCGRRAMTRVLAKGRCAEGTGPGDWVGEDGGQSQEGATGWRETGWSGSWIFRTLSSRHDEVQAAGSGEDRRARVEEEELELEFYKAERTPSYRQQGGQLGWGLGEGWSRNRKLRCWSRKHLFLSSRQGGWTQGTCQTLPWKSDGVNSEQHNRKAQTVLPEGSSPRCERVFFHMNLEVECLSSDNSELEEHCPFLSPLTSLHTGVRLTSFCIGWKENKGTQVWVLERKGTFGLILRT